MAIIRIEGNTQALEGFMAGIQHVNDDSVYVIDCTDDYVLLVDEDKDEDAVFTLNNDGTLVPNN